MHALGLLADGVEDALPVAQAPRLGLHFVGPAFQEKPREDDRQDKVSDGTSAPLRVQERPNPSHGERRGWGSASAPPICSAANWSSEMLLRKPPRISGCGAPVRKL